MSWILQCKQDNKGKHEIFPCRCKVLTVKEGWATVTMDYGLGYVPENSIMNSEEEVEQFIKDNYINGRRIWRE